MRFEKGEIVKFVVARTVWGFSHLNCECEVIEVGPGLPDACGGVCDYALHFPGEKKRAAAMDWQLQKLNPPREPIAMTRREEAEA